MGCFTIVLAQGDSMAHYTKDTIVAIATAQGLGGIGIVRVSGSLAAECAHAITGLLPKPRYAHYTPFYDAAGEVLDQGIVLFFPAPHSFTGEAVLELQGHGGTVVLDLLIQRCLALGARQARPGEFSERAFLNDRLDLTQAEAIADLIEASSVQAARNAVRSLQGMFSQKIHALTDQLTALRVYVEAAIDFPEEEIDFLTEGSVLSRLEAITAAIQNVLLEAQQGVLLREGMRVVIAGAPNAGKSSLLNALAGQELAIVTPIAGTTRDIVREQIVLDGLPVHIQDTAGLRITDDPVEKLGIERTLAAVEQADRILLVVDSSTTPDTSSTALWPDWMQSIPDLSKVIVVRNKADLSQEPVAITQSAEGYAVVHLSAQSGAGVALLRTHLKESMGVTQTTEHSFSARQRHLQSLQAAERFLLCGRTQLCAHGAGELLAEDLKEAQNALGEITGIVTSDALLGRIFSDFCIGK